MSFKQSIAFATLAALAALPSALAHGHITQITVGGTVYPGANPSNRQMYDYDTKSPFLWPDNSDQGFAVINDAELASGGKSAASGNVQVQATGGAAVEVKWDTWPESHKGPVMEYMARCPADSCAGVFATDLDWFKISEANYDPATGKWPAESIAATKTWSFTLPDDIPSGQYLVRHEILAMHTTGEPQFYPYAFELQLESSGTINPSPTGKFPAMYLTNNMATTFGIYGNENANFVVPGVPVYGSGGGSAPAPAPAPSSSSAAVPSQSAAAPSSSAAAPSSSAATPSSVAPAPSASGSSAASSAPAVPTSTTVPQVPAPVPTPETPAPETPAPETPAPIGGNLQSYLGAVEGISAPAVTAQGDKFVCDGNTFNFKNDALGRSCDIQRNACLRAANAKPNAEVGATMGKCESQAQECTKTAFSAVRRDQVISRFAKRAF